MRNPLYNKWHHFLCMFFVLPNGLYSDALSQRSVLYLKTFHAMFPESNVHTDTVFDFVKHEENIKRVMLLNGIACRERQLGPRFRRAVTAKSVYEMVGLPLDLICSTPYPKPRNTDTDSMYGYIDQSVYDKFNLTNSEAAISKEGWDYSPYYPPGETTTEFIFPSWNYGGRVPVAFWKDWTNHEMDMEQSTYRIPDNDNGYTDPDLMKIKTFDQFYDALWDTIYSLPHRCDNYTSIWSCLQGDEMTIPHQLDDLDDPCDKK